MGVSDDWRVAGGGNAYEEICTDWRFAGETPALFAEQSAFGGCLAALRFSFGDWL